MSNPDSNRNTSSWMERIVAKSREALRRMHLVDGGAKKSRGWMIGLVVCALLVGGISLAALGREGATKSEAATSAIPAAKASAGPAKAERNPEAVARGKERNAAKENSAASGGTAGEKEAGEPAAASPKAQTTQDSAGAIPNAAENEQESAELIRARAAWFHDQRAYPNKHIPAGALQKAIEQRERMRQQQRAAFKAGPTAQGIISFPGDALWHLTGPAPVNEPFSVNTGFPTASGRITAIAPDASDTTGQTVYIGGAAGGVWKTTNGGTSWVSLTDSQPSLAVGSIAIDPNNPQIVYVGTGEENFNIDAFFGSGVLKSINGGATWVQQGASTFVGPFSSAIGAARIGAIAVDPNNSNVVLAGVAFASQGSPSGIYRSADAGNTWSLVQGGDAGTAVVFDPVTSAKTAYAALGFPGGDTNNGIYKSIDEGATWTKLTGAVLPPSTSMGRITLAFAPSTSGNTAVIYAAIADASTVSSTLLGFFKTIDGGTTWTQLTSTPSFCNGAIAGTGQCFYDMAVGVHPTNANFVVVGGGAFNNNSTSLFKTMDGGMTWTGSAAGTDFTLGTTSVRPHVDTHAFAFAPNSATPRLYVGNDGGVWRTDNPVPTPPLWVDLNSTLAITQFYPGPSAGIGDENYGFGGTQDNDIEVFSGTLDWTNVLACGDGGFTAIDRNTPTTVYAGCDKLAGHVVRKSVFNGAVLPGPSPSFNPADSGIVRTDRAQFIPPLKIDENNPTTLYFGTCLVYQTLDGGNTWNPITGDLSAGNAATTCPAAPGNPTITTIDVPEKTSNIVFAGTSNGKVWRNGPAAPWTEIDNGLLPARHITTVRGKRGDTTGNIVYVALSGFGTCPGCDGRGHMFKSTDGGATWNDVSGDLPDAPVNDIIVYHQGNPTFDALYIATDVGVFSCPDPEAATPCKNWTVIGDGLPNSPILGLAMRRSSRILRAFTHGRSAWHIQLTDVQPSPLAVLSSLTPAAANVGDPTTAVTVTGLNFSANTLVLFDGVSVGTPTFVSTTQLTISVNSSLLTDGHVFAVTLSDPAGTDNSQLPFTVMNPILNATNMTPTSTLVGIAVTLHFTGTNFVNSTLVKFNNVQLFGGTASAGGTAFDVPVPNALLSIAMPVNVTVTNPVPGGGPTPPTSFAFTINPNPNPVAIFLPSPIVLGPIAVGANTSFTMFQIQNPGGAALNITNATITGMNAANFTFVPATVIPPQVSCNFENTKMVSVAAGGACAFGMMFTAGTPPGSANSVATLNVTDNAGGTAGTVQAVSVTGVVGPLAFLSAVNFGGVPVGSTSPTMNSTLLNVGGGVLNVSTPFTITGTNASDFHLVAAAAGGNTPCGNVPFSVNPGNACDVGLNFTPSSPASVENATINLTDNAVNSPQVAALLGSGIEITSISPSIVATGGPAFTLTVNGGGFAPSAVVNVNGSARLTTFVSANQLLASIPASDITTAGSLAISVTTPVPGGTQSEPKTLVVAQAPVATNDNIAFATDTSATPFRTTQDTTQATTNTAGFADPTPPSPSCAPANAALGGKARSVWFQFKAPASGGVVADTRFSSYPTILSVWTTNAPTFTTFTSVACSSGNVPTTPVESLVGFAVTSGTTYYVMVTDASAGGAGGTLTFSLDFASAAPANDPFASATTIAAAPFTTTENTILATANTGAADPVPSCASGTGLVSSGDANSVWFKFTAPSAGAITADTLTSPYGTILTAVTGAPGSFTEVRCNVSAGAGIAQSQVSFSAASGTQYFFMVSAFLGDGGTTNFHLTFTAGAALSAALTPSPVPFGNQRVNTTGAPVTVTLTNTGTGTITLAASNAVTLSGTDAADFAIDAGTTCTNGATLTAPSGTCLIKLTFKPGATGARTATLSVSDNATASPQTVTLNGTGIAPIATVTPSPLAFGNQRKGTTSAALTVTVKNTGTDTLNLAAANAIAFSGANAADFANAAGTTCANSTALAPTASCVINVTFTPSTTAAETATLTITDDANPTTQTVSLTGTGTTVTVALTPSPAAFNNQRVGTTSGALTITLTNSGSGSVTLAAANAMTLSGGNVGDFTITGGTCAVNLVLAAAPGPGNTCTVTATFTPAALGAETTTLTVTFQGSTPAATDNLTGTGVFPQATPSPTTVNFNNQVINTTSGAMTVTLTNGGTDVLHLAASNAAVIGGANAGDFAVAAGTTCTNGATVNAGANCVINLTFTPSALNARTATLTITDDANPTTQVATLNGTGTNPSPTITTLNPSSAIAGGAAFQLTIAGTNFVAGATANFGANPALTPTSITAVQIQVTVPAADIATAGMVNVTVMNPAPGGGTSGAAAFTIDNPAPTLASIAPTSGVLGQSVNMTLIGTGFVAGSIVNFGTNADSGGAVSNSGTTLTITIPAAQVNAVGPVNVTVTNPAPGGGTTAAQTFTVNNPVPTLTSILPTSGLLGQSVNLMLTGTNFVSGSIVNFGANADSGGVVSNGGNTLTITIPAAQVNAAGPVSVTVKNPAPGGGTTAAQTFTVNNPAPTLTSLAPTSGVLNQPVNLTLTGTNFIPGSIVNFGANADGGGVVSNGGNTLTITIPAAQLNAAGVVNTTVKNPAPGGGTSAAVQFTVNNPQPVATTLSPSSVLAGAAAFPLTITGSNFVAGAKVDFGADKGLTPASVTPAQIMVTIPAADVATGGSPQVIVNNPAPTVGPSAALTFTINNPMPTVTNATAGGKTHVSGGASFTLTATGTNFVSTSAVNFSGKAEPTTFVSATQITAAIPASDVATAGNVNVTVTNPMPGGGTSAASSFTVDGYTVSGPANTTVKAGQQAMITITVTPTSLADGFTNPVSLAVSGLPAHSTATFSSPTVTPGGAAATSTLTIMTTARGAAPPSAPVDPPMSPLLRLLPVMWFAAMLAGVCAMQLICRNRPVRRRYGALVPLALLLVTGAILAGCSGARMGTPAGPAQLTITATSGTMVQTTPANSVTLTVQ